MRPSVAAYLPTFFYGLHGFEGRVRHMYIDVLGYVTTGVGNLIDSPGAAQALPWRHADGSLASSGEVSAAWFAVDGVRTMPKGERQEGSIAMNGGGSAQMAALTSLRLSDADVDELFARVMGQFEATVKKYFPGFEGMPADAQLGLLSMAWGLGSAFAPHWPHFTAAMNASDYITAVHEGHVSNFTDARNAANALLFTNAAKVSLGMGDPATLYFPASVGGSLSSPLGPWVTIAGALVGLGVAAWAISRL